MRVLLACSLGGVGHLRPILELAHAYRRLGHETTLLVPPALAVEAERTGLAYLVGDEPERAFVQAIWAEVRTRPRAAVIGLIDRDLFAERATAMMLPAAHAALQDLGPGLVIREPCEYASAVAAHAAGVPVATAAISPAAIESEVLDMVTPVLERRRSGVAEAIAASPYLSSFPASLDPSPWPRTIRFRQARPVVARLPDWWPGDDRPLVYVSLGTVIGHLPDAQTMYRAALAALEDLPARVLCSVGRHLDPSSLQPLPANAHVEAWVEQAAVLAEAILVVCHGGSGTTYGALRAGVPVVACPLFGDQHANAKALQRSGAGLFVVGHQALADGWHPLGPMDVASLRRAIETALSEPAYRVAAESIADEMRSAPHLDEVVEALGALRP